jgi:iron(III) transport system ATP-binding protein
MAAMKPDGLEAVKRIAQPAQPAQPALELRDVKKRYGETEVVRGVDISLPPRSFLVLLGPSGCGKSTLLRMLSGLEAPSEGSIHILGREVANPVRGVAVPPGERGLGLVFQSYALWPHMTVAGNVEWPLKVARQPIAKREQRVRQVLSLLGIDTLAARYPNEISGGQQQRVAIARMLAPAPGLLLFDEPLSNLDAKLRVEMRSELLRVHAESGATSVYVTHDQIEAMTMATHVAVMRDGLVDQFGAPAELLERPASAFVATFVGTPAANVLPVRAEHGGYVLAGVRLCEVADGPANAQLLYSATDLSLQVGSMAIDGPVVPATLLEVAPMAGRHVCTLLCAGTRVSVIADAPPGVSLGRSVGLRFPPRPRAVFDADGRRSEVGAAS